MTLTRTILSVGLEYAWQRHTRRTLFEQPASEAV
jgi:hypothetical protein